MCKSILSLIFSLLLVLPLQAQKKITAAEQEANDSVPLLRGFAVGVDEDNIVDGIANYEPKV